MLVLVSWFAYRIDTSIAPAVPPITAFSKVVI